MIQTGKKALGKISSLIKTANLPSLLPAQFGVRIGRAFKANVLGSTFPNHVVRVISLCSEKKVFGVNAVPNVTNVKHAKALGDFAVVDFPGDARGYGHKRLPVFYDAKLAISKFVSGSSPKPTSLSFIDLAHKAGGSLSVVFHTRSTYREVGLL